MGTILENRHADSGAKEAASELRRRSYNAEIQRLAELAILWSESAVYRGMIRNRLAALQERIEAGWMRSAAGL